MKRFGTDVGGFAQRTASAACGMTLETMPQAAIGTLVDVYDIDGQDRREAERLVEQSQALRRRMGGFE